jgi:hypothetical protein
MPITDDLSTLFAPSPQGMGISPKILQGVVLTFSTVDGSNTVAVGPSTLTNLPMCLSGAEINFQPGDPVLMLAVGNTFMILCKVVSVGSSQFASASSATASGRNSISNFALATGFTTIVTTTVLLPVWANTCTYFVSATFSDQPVSSTLVQQNVGRTGGTFSPQSIQAFSAGQWSTVVATLSATATGLTPGSTLQWEMDLASSTAQAAATTANAAIGVTCLFSKQ